MKKVILIFLLALLGSCRNENSTITENSTTPDMVKDNIVYNRISKEDAIKIGELHNQYLDIVFKDFDYNNPNIEKQILEKFKSVDIELYKLNQSKFDNYESPLAEKEEVLNSVNNSIVVKIISDIQNDSSKFINYNVFSKHLDDTLLEYKDKISVENYDVLLVSFEVMKKSYLYWSPKENGGIGKGEIVIQKMEKLQNNTMNKSFYSNDLKSFSTTKSKIQQVIADDATGAAGAFISNAYFWTGGPASYFGSVAFSAAFSSAMGSAFRK